MDPVEEIAKKSDPTRWEKIKAFTELATVTISVIALAFSVWFSSQASLAANKAQEASQKASKETQELAAKSQDAMNLHNEQSVRPFLDFKYRFGIGITEIDIHVILRNVMFHFTEMHGVVGFSPVE